MQLLINRIFTINSVMRFLANMQICACDFDTRQLYIFLEYALLCQHYWEGINRSSIQISSSVDQNGPKEEETRGRWTTEKKGKRKMD